MDSQIFSKSNFFVGRLNFNEKFTQEQQSFIAQLSSGI